MSSCGGATGAAPTGRSRPSRARAPRRARGRGTPRARRRRRDRRTSCRRYAARQKPIWRPPLYRPTTRAAFRRSGGPASRATGPRPVRDLATEKRCTSIAVDALLRVVELVARRRDRASSREAAAPARSRRADDEVDGDVPLRARPGRSAVSSCTTNEPDSRPSDRLDFEAQAALRTSNRTAPATHRVRARILGRNRPRSSRPARSTPRMPPGRARSAPRGRGRSTSLTPTASAAGSRRAPRTTT